MVLTEKNATIGPSDASTATITPSDATSKRTTVASLQPRSDQGVEDIERWQCDQQGQVKKQRDLDHARDDLPGVRALQAKKGKRPHADPVDHPQNNDDQREPTRARPRSRRAAAKTPASTRRAESGRARRTRRPNPLDSRLAFPCCLPSGFSRYDESPWIYFALQSYALSRRLSNG